MSIKYISKTKDNKWKVSTSKTGKAIKIEKTQKEALIYAASLSSTEGVMIKRSSGWKNDPFWRKSKKEFLTRKISVEKEEVPQSDLKVEEFNVKKEPELEKVASSKEAINKDLPAKKVVAKKAEKKPEKIVSSKEAINKDLPAKKVAPKNVEKKPEKAVSNKSSKDVIKKDLSTKKAIPKKAQPLVSPKVNDVKIADVKELTSKKSSKKLRITILVIFTLLLIGGAIVAGLYFGKVITF